MRLAESLKTTMPPKPLLTPKDLADAIGASESSLRRWVDSGRIRMTRTAGGHRRIPLEEAVRFIRESGSTLLRPDLLGLDDVPAGEVRGARAPKPGGLTDEQRLFDSLAAGGRRAVRGMVVSWFIEGRPLPAILDGPVRGAMHRLGELFHHDPRGILIEHRGTEICLDALRELRTLLPAPEQDAPVAIGGAPEGDPYLIPSTMCAITLADAGYREVHYGPNTPTALLADAAREHDAAIVWLSVSAPLEKRPVRQQVAELAQALASRGGDTILVIGGRYATEVMPRDARDARNVHLVNSMAELSGLAKGFRGGRALNK